MFVKIESREKIEAVLRHFLTNTDLDFIAAIYLKSNTVIEGAVVVGACNEVETGITTYSLQLYKDRYIGGVTSDDIKYVELIKSMIPEKLKTILEIG